MIEGTWYLKWNESITEDVFNQIVNAFKKEGREFFPHCNFVGFTGFKNNNYIRTNLEGERSFLPEKGWCIDNNPQGIKKEIFVSDILGEKKEPVKERGFSNGDIVVVIANTSDSCNKIGEIGILKNNAQVVVNGCKSEANHTRHTDIRHATEIEKKAFEAGYKTLEEYEKKFFCQPSSPSEKFPAGARVETRYGKGTVIAKHSESENNYLVEHDEWRGGHNGNNSHFWELRKVIHPNSGYYYLSSDMKIIAEPVKAPDAVVKDKAIIPDAKYYVGEDVQICEEGRDKGWGWQGVDQGQESYIEGVARLRGTITEIKWNEKRNEWSYRLTGSEVTGWLAEHAISLVGESVKTPLKNLTLKPVNLANTKIWIGDNPELSRRVQKALFNMGCRWTSETFVKLQGEVALYIDSTLALSYGSKDREDFKKTRIKKFNYGGVAREIFPSDLGIIMTGSYKVFDKKIIDNQIKKLEKPYSNVKEVTKELMLSHPYFRTLDKDALYDVMRFMNFSSWGTIPGKSKEKLEWVWEQLYGNLDTKAWKWEFEKRGYPISQSECILIKDVEEKKGTEMASLQSVVLMKEPPKSKLIIV